MDEKDPGSVPGTDPMASLRAHMETERFSLEALSAALLSLATIRIKNPGGEPVFVKVSKTRGKGMDGYFEIPPGGEEKWDRYPFFTVTITLSGESSDDGIYYVTDHKVRLTTTCNDFEVAGAILKYVGPPTCPG
jgi:hypothetical protein